MQVHDYGENMYAGMCTSDKVFIGQSNEDENKKTLLRSEHHRNENILRTYPVCLVIFPFFFFYCATYICVEKKHNADSRDFRKNKTLTRQTSKSFMQDNIRRINYTE